MSPAVLSAYGGVEALPTLKYHPLPDRQAAACSIGQKTRPRADCGDRGKPKEKIEFVPNNKTACLLFGKPSLLFCKALSTLGLLILDIETGKIQA
jgi:hypothetical protein